MDFGIFDHLDQTGQAGSDYYEDRLKLIERYDQIGIYAYHVAEHHATPLGMAPSPSVFLAAVAQRTRRLRFGPLVYCVPMYHPVRLLEEICMLDQLSGGRFELGVGRGISPIELSYYDLDYDEGPAKYREALEIILRGIGSERLTYDGEFFQVDDMPMRLTTVQKPHPPLWYGIHNPASAGWPGGNGVNIVSNAPAARVREVTDAYREARADARLPGPEPKIGMTRYMILADSREAAMEMGRRAYPVWRRSFMALWDEHGKEPIGVHYPEEFDGVVESGQAVAGTPDQVGEELQRQIETAGINYMICRFAFGDLTLTESLNSVELFNDHLKGELKAAA